MRSSPAITEIRFPGESSWEFWRVRSDGTWSKESSPDKKAIALHAYEALAWDSMPYWSQTFDEEELRKITSLRWEAHDHFSKDGWGFWKVYEDGNKCLCASINLVNSESVFPPRVHHFDYAARLLPHYAFEITIWQELGFIIAGFNHESALLHAATLNSKTMNYNGIQELKSIYEALKIREMMPSLLRIRSWISMDELSVETLRETFACPVIIEPRPAPRFPSELLNIIPESVALERQKLAVTLRRKRFITVLFAGLFLYLAAWSGWLNWRSHQISMALSAIHKQQPEVDAIRESKIRWDALSPAFDREAYPIELFHQIALHLPEEGIRLKEFSLDPNQIVISGEASSTSHALKLQADLKTNPALSKYAFITPQPTILEDNRALFRIEGALIKGVDNESQ